MSKEIEQDPIEDRTLQTSEVVTTVATKQLHYRLVTETCLSHIWYRPVFRVLASDHHNGEKFFNPIHRPEGSRRWGLVKWLSTRKSSTWKVDSAKETAEFYATSRALPQNRPNRER